MLLQSLHTLTSFRYCGFAKLPNEKYFIALLCPCSTWPPPKARKKPPPAPKPNLPMCKANYDYDATDTDKLTLTEGDLNEIIKEGETALPTTCNTSVKIIKNEIRSRDDTVPKTVDTRSHCKVWLRACNNLPQPPPYILVFWGCGRLLHALKHTLQWPLVSTVFGTVSSLHLKQV